MAELTDLEKAYRLGYREGYNRALPTRREIDEMVDRVKKEIVALRGKACGTETTRRDSFENANASSGTERS